MKSYKHLSEKIFTKENFYLAYINASKGKSSYHEVQLIDLNIDKFVNELFEEVNSGKYKVSKYDIFQLYSGGKLREIYKLPMKDRVVLHAIMNYLEPIFRNSFIVDTYLSIKYRGVHLCLKNIKRALKDAENTKYCLKLDIRKCYPSIDLSILKEKLRKKFNDKKLLDLLFTIIDSCDKGLPIGNYTSQYFNNFYFSDLDHYIKEKLLIKYYFRYCDDIIILSDSKDKLHSLFKIIKEELEKLNVLLKPNYQIFEIDKRPLDFVGFIISRNYTKIRKRTKKKFKSKCDYINFNNLCEEDINSLGSYWGIFKHSDSRNLWQNITKNKCFKQLLKYRNKLMKWHKINKDKFKSVECTNKYLNKYIINFCPITIKEKDENSENEITYTKYLLKEYLGSITLEVAKLLAIDLVKEYDSSLDVNSFTIDSMLSWFNKATRIGLINSINLLKAQGEKKITLWFEVNNSLEEKTFKIEDALSFIDTLEKYAILCTKTTNLHIIAILSMNTIEDICKYNFTVNYPNKIGIDTLKS